MPFRLLLITQESTRAAGLAGALARARSPQGVPVELEVVPAATLRDDSAATSEAVERADFVLVTHLLTEDIVAQARAVLQHAGRRTQVLVLQSLRPLLLETRLGGKRLPQVLAAAPELGRLFSGPDLTGSFREVLQDLPRILSGVGPEHKELRTWLECLLYWREPSAKNLRNMAFRLADLWSGTPGRWHGQYEPPELYPEVALYHPSCGVTVDVDDLPAAAPAEHTIGLLLMRGSVLAGDVAAIDEWIERAERRGFRVLAAYADSFDFRTPIARWFDPAGVDAVVSFTGFPLVGGHNRHAGDQSRSFLAARGALYLTPPGLMVQSIAEWQASRLGLAPMEAAMEVAIHEAEGGIEPLVLHGAATPGAPRQLLADRAERFLDRLERWLALRRLPNSAKRIAITLFSFPPGKGSVGTAAYLDVFASAHTILRRLAREGYAVEVPASAAELLARIVTGDDKRAPLGGAELAVAARLGRLDYERLVPEWRRLRRQWGEFPGRLDTDGRNLLIHGVALGNVFVGVQPSFGFEGDPMRLLFEASATPHPAFVAYYRWLEREFGAHAVVHLGTHGALEFMPGKQAGLSGACWPDVLAGSLPNVYLYAVNNPSEGTIAKRRGYAVTIGHLTPPTEQAGLYRDLEGLRGMARDFLGDDDPERRRRTAEALVLKASELNLDRDVALPQNDRLPQLEQFVDSLVVHLREIESRRIPVGLHTIDERPSREACGELLGAIAEHDRPERNVRSIPRLLLAARGDDPDGVAEGIRRGDRRAVDRWTAANACARRVIALRHDSQRALAVARAFAADVPAAELARSLDFLRRVGAALADTDELAPLVRALAGCYVTPAPGGDPVRAPEVLPTGRNLHALDPGSVPSATAVHHAQVCVDLLLARRRRELGRFPRRIGMVLWGLDNIKTQGEAIAQAFLLLGTRPKRNSIGRVADVEVVPLEQLGRPRIDVTLNASGIFRDIFGAQMQLLDRAVRVVAALDEPPEQNFVRQGWLALRDRLGDERALRRVFSNEPGNYGTHVDHMVQLSSWEQRSDLARVWLGRKGFAYDGAGGAENDPEALQALAEGIDTTYQNIDSSEVSLIDVDHYFEYLGGMTALVEAASGTRPDAVLADTTAATARVRSLAETLRLETRTKLLNPKWYEGMLAHGYEGVEEIRKRLDYTFGWSATSDAVDEWVYREVHRTYVENDDVRRRMQEANAPSYQALVGRLAEAEGRGFWHPTAEEHMRLRERQSALEDQLEGVASRV